MSRLIAFALIMVSTPCFAEEFLGLDLGGSLKDATEVVAGSSLKFVSHKVEGDKEIVTFSGNHRLKGASTTELTFYKKQLLEVDVHFDDTSGSIHRSLDILLTRKYGRLQSTDTGSQDIEFDSICTADLMITLSRFYRMTVDIPHATLLAATHNALQRQMFMDLAEQSDRTADELGEL